MHEMKQIGKMVERRGSNWWPTNWFAKPAKFVNHPKPHAGYLQNI